jgi:hypothetical protein
MGKVTKLVKTEQKIEDVSTKKGTAVAPLATKEGATDSQPAVQEEMVGKLLNFFVGIDGSAVYKVNATQEDLNLKDFVEAVATIEINVISSLLEDKANAKEGIELFINMKKDIVAEAIKVLIDKYPDIADQKEEILKLFV